MTIFPFQLNEVAHVYGKLSRLAPPDRQDREPGEPLDVVHISEEARQRQATENTKSGAGKLR